MNLVGLVLTLILGSFIIGGSLCTSDFKDKKKLKEFIIPIVFGIIVTLAIVKLLPNGFTILTNDIGFIRGIIAIIILILIGFVLLRLFEMFINNKTNKLNKNIKKLYLIGLMFSLTFIIYNILIGINTYLIYEENFKQCLVICIGVVLYNVPIGMFISILLVNSPLGKNKTLILSLIISLSTLLGGIIISISGGINELLKGLLYILIFSMFMYISSSIIKELYDRKKPLKFVLNSIIGIVIVVFGMILKIIVG